MTRDRLTEIGRSNKKLTLLSKAESSELLQLAQNGYTMEEVVDNVREALGQAETHYLVIADDVAIIRTALSAIFDECWRKSSAKLPVDNEVFELAADALERIQAK